MKIEANLFGKILIKLNEMAELLGYRHLQIKSWQSNDKGEIEFCLVDGETKEEFRIVLPKVKE